jgi:hypothetical protein
VIHLPESTGLEAVMAQTQKSGKQQAAGKRKAAAAKKRTAGRIQLRSDTAPYRAAAQEQAVRVQEEIETALADARRVREEIEARMATQWHNR